MSAARLYRVRLPARFASTSASVAQSHISAASSSATTSSSSSEVDTPQSEAEAPQSAAAPLNTPTHFKITLRRSAISLGPAKQGTLAALGLHRRHQTVYHAHAPTVAGQILALKELLEVQNVCAHEVRNGTEQRQERKAPRGWEVVGTRRGALTGV